MPRDASRIVGTRAAVIPDGWEEHHRPTADLTRTLPAELWTGAFPEWIYDPATGTETRNLGAKVWAGLVRLQQLRRARVDEAGTQQVSTHDYLLVLPHHVDGVDLAHWVKTRGRLWRVIDILTGSLEWQRDLIITDNLEAPRG